MSWIRALIALASIAVMPTLSAAAAVPANGRAWELVSPSDPVAAVAHGALAIDAGGDRLAYLSLGAMPGAPAGDLAASSVAIRGPGGWETTPVGLPYNNSSFQFPQVAGFSADLLTSVWTSQIPIGSFDIPSGHTGLYRRGPGGQIELLADTESRDTILGVSTDAQRIVFSNGDHLVASDAGRVEGASIYESVAGGLRQVDVGTGGVLLSPCGSLGYPRYGVSGSGERVFFANPDPSTACETPSKIYLREGDASTVEISTSHCDRLDCNAEQPVSLVGATPDGAAAYMVTSQQLTDDDRDSGADLYRYDVGDHTLTLISVGAAEASGEVTGARVPSSNAGSRVYFHTLGTLQPGQGDESGENLYMADANGIHFVAPVGSDAPLEVSEDGRVAMLETPLPLTEGDTDGRRDIYRYDADTGGLWQVSLGPVGGNGPFDASLSSPISGQSLAPMPSRALADDGRRLFFSTAERLLPEDGNEAIDVYEWFEGGLGLVSSGTGGDDADFATASADGSSVVFNTAASLLPRDRDSGDADLYVARLGGGFPEPETGVECSGEACRGGSPPRAPRPSPASAVAGRAGRPSRLRLLRLPRDAGERLAATGRVAIELVVPEPGLVSARATARLAGRREVVARGAVGAVRRGRVHLVLRATASWSKLALRQGVRTRLTVRQHDLILVRRLRLDGGGA